MKPRILIITGTSGSGKTTFMRTLEDHGFYCVDNIPIALIPKFVELVTVSSEPIEKAALVVDIRERGFPENLYPVLEDLKKMGVSPYILFLDADDPTLIRRFKETRRKHPVDTPSLEESIKLERKLLSGVKEIADEVIDTTELTPAQLRERAVELLKRDHPPFMIRIFSFGYKYGIPQDADIVFDARILPNPFFVPGLKEKSGLDREVREFLIKKRETEEALSDMENFIEKTVHYYKKDGRTMMTVAVGCTGGRHRSVFLAEELARSLREKGYEISLLHRDIEKG